MNLKTYLSSLLLVCIMMLGLSLETFAQSNPQFRVLVFSRTKGFRHQSIPDGVVALKKMARDQIFDIFSTEDESYITDKNLERYDVIVMMSTTGTIFNDEQKAVIQRFVQAGKGIVGIHSATDTEYQWPWYTKTYRGSVFEPPPPTDFET